MKEKLCYKLAKSPLNKETKMTGKHDSSTFDQSKNYQNWNKNKYLSQGKSLWDNKKFRCNTNIIIVTKLITLEASTHCVSAKRIQNFSWARCDTIANYVRLKAIDGWYMSPRCAILKDHGRDAGPASCGAVRTPYTNMRATLFSIDSRIN